MKVFYVILAVFLLMVGLILCNALYINRLSFDLTERLDALPAVGEAGCEDMAHELLCFWSSKTSLVGISVGYPAVDRISEQAAVLHAAAACGDVYGYRAAVALLRDAIEDLRRLERPTLIHS